MNSESAPPIRCRLAEIARAEAMSGRYGDAQKAGPEIECYLSVFRAAMNEHGSTTRYADLSTGYDWCGAFVYYCCRQAGYAFPPKASPDARWTLAAVPAWHVWATAGGFFHPAPVSAPEPGDIVLFNRVFDGNPLDHIGIVVDVTPGFVLCAEGNYENRTALVERPYGCIAGYVRLSEP